MVEKLFCQQASQSEEGNFKLGTMGEGHEDHLSSVESVDQTGKRRVQGDVDSRDLIIKSSKGQGGD